MTHPDGNARILVVEDNGVVNVGLQMSLRDAGYMDVVSASDYRSALALIDGGEIAMCILDLDLGSRIGRPVRPEPEGRRLLAVLRARAVSTIVYSAILHEEPRLLGIDPDVLIVDKSQPVERVVEALEELTARRAAGSVA